MVVDEQQRGRPDRVFHALSDATRRDILRRTSASTYSVSELATSYPMSFAAVQKHVAVLASAGLVAKTRRGREQRVSAQLAPLAAIRSELDTLESVWRGRITRMSELLTETSQHPDDLRHEPPNTPAAKPHGNQHE